MADTLTQGQKLDSGQSLTSNNGAYTLTLQDDGNL
ncbi:lectin, partial [Mycobacteroides abscessus]